MGERTKPDDTVIITAPTHVDGEGPGCLVVVGGAELARRWDITAEPMIIGRDATCEIPLDVRGVSRQHARIQRTPLGVVITDLNSTNGTRVNGVPIEMRHLTDGDRVVLGRAVLKYLVSDNLEGAYYDELYRLTTTDDLTGTYNRRHFFVTMARELSRARRHGRLFSLMMIDIDHFKAFNDAYGHQAGDDVLRQVAQRTQAVCRREDVLGRYGGEEFILMLPETGLHGAATAAERVRKGIAFPPFIVGERKLGVTVSIGVSDLGSLLQREPEYADEVVSIEELARKLVKTADEHLYRAKGEGRNRVVA